MGLEALAGLSGLADLARRTPRGQAQPAATDSARAGVASATAERLEEAIDAASLIDLEIALEEARQFIAKGSDGQTVAPWLLALPPSERLALLVLVEVSQRGSLHGIAMTLERSRIPQQQAHPNKPRDISPRK